jgi:hypothetical protein
MDIEQIQLASEKTQKEAVCAVSQLLLEQLRAKTQWDGTPEGPATLDIAQVVMPLAMLQFLLIIVQPTHFTPDTAEDWVKTVPDVPSMLQRFLAGVFGAEGERS